MLMTMGSNTTVMCTPPATIAPFCPTALTPPGPSSTTLCKKDETCKYTCTGPTSSGECSLAVETATQSWNVTCINVFPIGSSTAAAGSTSVGSSISASMTGAGIINQLAMGMLLIALAANLV